MSKANSPQLAVNQDFGADDVLENVKLEQSTTAADSALLESSISSAEIRKQAKPQTECEQTRERRMSSTPSLESMRLEPELKQVRSTHKLSAALVSKQISVAAPKSANTVFDRLVTWIATRIRIFVEKLLAFLGNEAHPQTNKNKVIIKQPEDADTLLLEAQTRKRRRIRRPMLHSFE